MRKGLSNVISAIIILFIVLTVLLPFLIYYTSLSSSNVVRQQIVNNYVYLKNLQVNQVTTGHPAFYYNGSSIYVVYTNGTFVPPSNVTIVSILYLNQNGIWQNVTTWQNGTLIKYPITLSTQQILPLPSYTQNRPVIITTSLGNIFFLAPNSSIGPYSTSGKGGVTILSQIYTKNGPLGVSTNVTTNIYGKIANYTTPVVFPNQTGTFFVKAPKYVYYENSKGQIITGVFYNWIKLGNAILNSTTSQAIKVTLLNSPLVLIANYTQLVANVSVTLKSNFPGNVTVLIDGKSYSFNGSTTIQIPAGFVNITVLKLQGNYTQKSNVIKHYNFSNITIQNGLKSSSYISTSAIIFIPPNSNPTIILYYKNDYNYYKVTLVAYHNKYNNQVIIGNNLYNYSQSYWFIQGNYTFDPTGKFTGYKTYGAQIVTFEYSNGTTINFNFPNLPRYVIINQPMTIIVTYNWILNWAPLY
ncbi:MAG: hypothetical protein QW232_07625 [Saccharolobus sp.]